MSLSSLTTYQYADATVVNAACEYYGFNWENHVIMENKRILADYTGLSLHNINRALTNLRKYH